MAELFADDVTDIKTRDEKLESLRDLLIEYIDSEKVRLQTERRFLTSVKENSLKGADFKANRIDKLVVFDDLVEILGVLSSGELKRLFEDATS
jgi:hypothetical protein